MARCGVPGDLCQGPTETSGTQIGSSEESLIRGLFTITYNMRLHQDVTKGWAACRETTGRVQNPGLSQ